MLSSFMVTQVKLVVMGHVTLEKPSDLSSSVPQLRMRKIGSYFLCCVGSSCTVPGAYSGLNKCKFLLSASLTCTCL